MSAAYWARLVSSSWPWTIDAVGQAEEVVDLPHPVGVAAGQVVVHGDDMDALAGERVQVDGQRGDQGLALAGLHFRDLAVVQDHAADELDVEMALAEGAAAGLADHGEGFRQQVVQRRAIGQAGAEFRGLGGQSLVRQRLHAIFQGVDRRNSPLIPFQGAVIGGAENGAGD